jgi:hypothetical protein
MKQWNMALRSYISRHPTVDKSELQRHNSKRHGKMHSFFIETKVEDKSWNERSPYVYTTLTIG